MMISRSGSPRALAAPVPACSSPCGDPCADTGARPAALGDAALPRPDPARLLDPEPAGRARFRGADGLVGPRAHRRDLPGDRLPGAARVDTAEGQLDGARRLADARRLVGRDRRAGGLLPVARAALR